MHVVGSEPFHKFVPVALILLFVASLFCTPSFAEEELSGLDRVIRIAGDHNYPPYEYLDQDGLPTGYNIELSQAIARVMGMDINIQLATWGEVRHALEKGDVDILMGMAHTKERLDEVNFSTPHAKVHQAVWVRKNNSEIKTVADLAGREVIVMKGSVMHDFMLENEIAADLFMVQTLADALNLLASGRHDCALVAKLPGEYLLSESNLDNIQPIARPVVAQDYGFAVKKDNHVLLAQFDEGLSLLKKSGEYREIHDKWLGVLQPHVGVPWANIIRYGSLVLGPLLLVLLIFVLWSRTLRQQVALRTMELEREVAERKRAAEELQVRQKQLLHADKMTSLGILVSGVAHEINNPNGLIQLSLPQLKKTYSDIEPLLEKHFQENGNFKLGWFNYSRMRTEIPNMLQEMHESSNRIKRTVEELKDFARRDDSGLNDKVELNQVITSALRLVGNTLYKATVNFRAEYAPDLPDFRGNGHRIEQVAVNLIVNACQALTSTDQAITIQTFTTEDGRMVVMKLEDEGCGLDEETLARITDPFFTTKRETGGTGLGLSISDGIVKDHKGRLEFSSQLGKGMQVLMFLPIYEEQ